MNDSLHADVLVGAGGHFCPVARALGAREGDQIVTVAAQEIEFPILPEDEEHVHLRGEIPELYFCRDLAGYGWAFRKGNFLNIGLGRLNSPGVAAHVQSFCRFLRDRGKVGCELPERFHGHAYRIYERIAPKLVDDGVLFIGDAAGLAYPQSGEGIRPAIESGLMAADVLAAAAGDYRRVKLEPYARAIAALGTRAADRSRIASPRPFCNSPGRGFSSAAGLRATSCSTAGSCIPKPRPWPSRPQPNRVAV